MTLRFQRQSSGSLKSVLSMFFCFCLQSMQAFQHLAHSQSRPMKLSMVYSRPLPLRSPTQLLQGVSTVRGTKRLEAGSGQITPKSNAVSEFEFIVSPERLERKIRGQFGTNIDNSPTLVLNADYTPLSHAPLSLWNWQDSLRAVLSGKARVVSEYSGLIIRSVSCSFKLPSVIALNTYYRKPAQVPVMTRRYVYLRDGFCCQVRLHDVVVSILVHNLLFTLLVLL